MPRTDEKMPLSPRSASLSQSRHSRQAGAVRLMTVVLAVVATGLTVLAAPRLLDRSASYPPSAIQWGTNLQDAIDQSGESGRPLLIRFGATWCGACQFMKQTVFSDPEVGQLVRRAFVPVDIDLTSADGPAGGVANRYRVEALPTLVVLDIDQNEVGRRVGFMDKPQLQQWLAGQVSNGAVASHGRVSARGKQAEFVLINDGGSGQ